MFVEINPLVKLTYKVDTSTKLSYMDDSEVVDYELINDDAKYFYKNINFKGKTLEKVLVMLCDNAKDNGIAVDKLKIITNDAKVNIDDVKYVINRNSKYKYSLEITVDLKEKINESEITGIETKKEYTITFDTDGGSKIDNQKVKENEKVVNPSHPTKQGYSFVEWQLNGFEYIFDNSVTEDITLKAKWKKNNSEQVTPPLTLSPIESEQPTTTPTPSPIEKEKTTFNKINLNDNIRVEEYPSFFSCGGWVYSDTSATSEVISAKNAETLNLLKSLMVPGGMKLIASESSGINRLDVSIDELHLVGDYGSFGTEYNNIHRHFENQVKNIMKDYTMYGECGDTSIVEILDEAKCNKWNLNCSRW